MANAFVGLDPSVLTALRDDLVEGIRKVALNQSYSLNGRSLTRANLGELTKTLNQVQAALGDASGDAPSVTYVNFTGV